MNDREGVSDGIDYEKYAKRLMEDRTLVQNPNNIEEVREASIEYADLLLLPKGGQDRLYEEMQQIIVEIPPMTTGSDSDPLENISV